MNFILFIIFLSVVANTNCELPIKIDIGGNEDGIMLVTKMLFIKLDWIMFEIDKFNKNFDIITERLNQQDEKINKLSTKVEIGEVLELINTNVTELNQQIFLKLNKQDENINQLPTKADINELMKLSNNHEAEINEVMKLNHQVFQKLNQQDEKINTLQTKGEIGEVLELINTNVTELNRQIFQKLNQQDEKINQLPTKAEVKELIKLSNKHEAEISEVLEKNNTTIPEMSKNESFNKTVNEILQNPLLKPYIDFHNYNFSYSKSTETVNKMLSNQTLKEMGNWLVILRRQDGSEDFNRNWLDYQNGFGNPNGEFFIGLEKLHAITTNGGRHELLFVLQDFNSVTKYAKYDDFVVGNETEKYELHKLGDFDGDAGDSMQWHLNMKFSTKDRDNDLNDGNCAEIYKGGWWFSNCFISHLTGPYYNEPTSNVRRGINWYHWHGAYYSLKFVEMMVRPKA